MTVEATGRGAGRGPRRRAEVPAGMHRIGGSSSGLDVTEDNNTVKGLEQVFQGPRTRCDSGADADIGIGEDHDRKALTI